MKLNFLVAPDFSPDSFSGWYMLSTLLQRRSGIGLHLMMPANPAEQTALLAADEVDLLYANPFDAAALVRSEGYRAFARPAHRSDEMIIATAAGSSLERVLVQGEDGYVIMTAAGEEAVLTVLAKSNAQLGLIFLDIKRAAASLSKII